MTKTAARKETYEIQVEVECPKKCGHGTEKVWTTVCPSNSVIPYRFTTKEKAIHMAEICYGSSFVPYRII